MNRQQLDEVMTKMLIDHANSLVDDGPQAIMIDPAMDKELIQESIISHTEMNRDIVIIGRSGSNANLAAGVADKMRQLHIPITNTRMELEHHIDSLDSVILSNDGRVQKKKTKKNQYQQVTATSQPKSLGPLQLGSYRFKSKKK